MQALPHVLPGVLPAWPVATLGLPAVLCLPRWYREVKGQDPGNMWRPMGFELFWWKE